MLPSVAVELFHHQHGLLAKRQLLDRLSPSDRRRVYRHPEVEHLSTRVVRHRVAPRSLGAQLIGPVLDALPAVLWDASGARWYGFGRDSDPVVQVARVGNGVPGALGRVHRLVDLCEDDVTDHHGVPIARAERVILGLAAAATREWKPTRFRNSGLTEVEALLPVVRRMAPVLDHAWGMGFIDGRRIHAMADRMGGHGQAGIIVLRELLRVRPPDYLPPESGLEARFEEVIALHRHAFRRQVELFDDRGLIGRVDYLAIRRPLVVEVNSERFHTSRTDRAADDDRYERLLASGRSVLVIWEYDVWHRAGQVRRAVASCLTSTDPHPTVHRPTPPPWELLADRSEPST